MTFKQMTLVKNLVIEKLDRLEEALEECRNQRTELINKNESSWCDIPESLQSQMDFLRNEISTYAGIIDDIESANVY